ncbi:MAG TPA: xanthine dehydrogenase family protein subunit M [Mycobacteriales bacterium]|nr:xanthine dehydrogenase family protein subunit M [Mycobacteriales bacterium]
MIPSPFEYVAAQSADEAVALLQQHGDEAKLLAGGHSLLPMMKVRLAAPSVLIDVGGLSDLDYIRVDGSFLAVGATTRHQAVTSSELVREQVPLLAWSAGLVGDPQIRHRGTIGGSLAHADPAADLPMALSAVDGRVVVQGPSGRREIGVDDFFQGYFETALEPEEMIVELRMPARPGQPWGYQKFTRRANDWAIVGVAAVGGRVSLANMGPQPVRAVSTEQAVAGGASATEAAALAAEEAEPAEDMHADAPYRRHLARVLTKRALVSAGVPA